MDGRRSLALKSIPGFMQGDINMSRSTGMECPNTCVAKLFHVPVLREALSGFSTSSDSGSESSMNLESPKTAIKVGRRDEKSDGKDKEDKEDTSEIGEDCLVLGTKSFDGAMSVLVAALRRIVPNGTLADGKRSGRGKRPYRAEVHMSGYDAKEHGDFDLCQRLIGAKGRNVRPFWEGTRSHANFGGEGSLPVGLRPCWKRSSKLLEGALRLEVTSPTIEDLVASVENGLPSLESMDYHWSRFLGKKHLPYVPLFTVYLFYQDIPIRFVGFRPLAPEAPSLHGLRPLC
ncbi:unnamed protein product [Effrenium voratum]|nr:unnamed protein product [Effrenium voratum]